MGDLSDIEKLRYEYYWKCDREKYLFDYLKYRSVMLELWNIEKKDDLDRYLKEAFCGHDEFYKLLKEILYEYIKCPSDYELCKRFLSDLQAIKDDGLGWYHWDFARRLFASVNAYCYAVIARNNEEAILLSYKNTDLILRRFSAYVSRGDYSEAKSLVELINEEELGSRWPDRFSYVQDYMNTICLKKYDKGSFSKYVKDKKIVVMGVAPHEEEIQHELDSVYARINYFGQDSIPLVDRSVPTNIGYYNVDKSKVILTDKKQYLGDIDYAICKDIVNEEDIPEQYKDKIRKAFYSFFGSPFGHLLLVPIMVYDFSHFETRGISILHTNFYCSDKAYYGEYKGNISLESLKGLLIGLASHDLIGNMILMKSWYSDGLFSCDEELKKVLNLSEFEFGLKVENAFRAQLII